jgi:hypothetical protein
MFIKVENGAAVGEAFGLDQLRLLFPNVSFALPVDPEFLASVGYATFVQTTPLDNTTTHKAVEVAPARNIDGSFMQAWQLTPKTEQELQIEKALEAIKVRNLRKQLLLESDWTQLEDAPVDPVKKVAWATYRQALRDVTSQEKFPFDVTWPVKP